VVYVEETFFRPPEIGREQRTLPAATYNLAHLLLQRSDSGCVFVPIRSMQYLAVVDVEETIFVHREGRRLMEISWCQFHPGERAALTEPVRYTAVYYASGAQATMARLQVEYLKALQELEQRKSPPSAARVIKLDTGGT
jgi:hypothetical protein